MFRITEWIKTHLNETFAIVVAGAILVFTFLNVGWWGDRALGVLIGATTIVVILRILGASLVLPSAVTDEKRKLYWQWFLPWALIAIPTITAVVVRQASGYRLVWPIQFKTPGVPQPQSLFLILIAILLVMLLIVFVRALHRGEGVAIESHWGGLGGGIGGFQLSAPLIYLLGIVFLLVVSSALAWRIFPPPQNPQVNTAASPPASADTSTNSSPSPTTSPGNISSTTPNP